ncbi:hypothetical protein MJO28_012451 [Puccinia striiformis f. sp. tritici]|uniref:Uncharacterized protein n=1 Tax=Puccinia striiformis f. sp. tritici TaxID=168172 RepID=A0ACC0E1I7_9BASI|nr:hypothetical protein Pst134EA_022646 [Puccinia striiformis f. sp. tritici]KAH9455170.1 hypothetical protein Pst134EA_022646 [Puccinia striiformis f. sp. tritici]KAI7942424.1 hypothetical protein MJO28_012451 [Puccinia striiformis f. sp. tritici]KAI7945579.1 hypothetical protein MJO29_011967 [Puccinia striiformis f. sp. tritici]
MFATVKQQRLDRPSGPTPNHNHLLVSSKERLDKIVACFQLEHCIFLNRFSREYQAHKVVIKMEEIKQSYRIVEKSIADLQAELEADPTHINFLNF